MTKYLTIAIVTALIAACATRVDYISVYPRSNPPGGLSQAQKVCKAKSQAVSGYDWIDAIVRRENALNACMLEYGYRLQAMPN